MRANVAIRSAGMSPRGDLDASSRHAADLMATFARILLPPCLRTGRLSQEPPAYSSGYRGSEETEDIVPRTSTPPEELAEFEKSHAEQEKQDWLWLQELQARQREKETTEAKKAPMTNGFFHGRRPMTNGSVRTAPPSTNGSHGKPTA